jgi:hypothetical protein
MAASRGARDDPEHRLIGVARQYRIRWRRLENALFHQPAQLGMVKVKIPEIPVPVGRRS